MLRKDMRCPDEQEDDDSSSVESFPELPNTRINGKCHILLIVNYHNYIKFYYIKK